MRTTTLERPAAVERGTPRGAALAAYWPLVPVLLGVTLLALPVLAHPWGPDQAIFATIGDAINRGGFPYVDAWDQKPPAIYLLYALALRLPGPLMQRVRVFDLVWTLATMTVLYELARSMWGARAGVFASLLYGVTYFTTQGWWYIAQPDGFAGLPLLLGLLLYRRAGGRRAWLLCLAAGALAGLAFQLRFIAGPIVALFALTDLWERDDGPRGMIRRMLWLGAGFVAVQAALLAYLAVGHAVREYIAATRFASGYVSTGWPFAPRERTLAGFLNYMRGAWLSVVFSLAAMTLPALAAGFDAWFGGREPRARQLTLMCVVGFAGIAAQQKFFWYHWQLLLPLLALLAGLGWDRIFARVEAAAGMGWRGTGGKALLVGALLIATPSFTDYGYGQWDDFLHRNDSGMARVRWDNSFGGYGEGTYSYLADVQVAQYLRARTRRDDTVYIFGYDPLIYLLSERRSASRFIYTLPMMSSWAPKHYLTDFLGDLDRRKPVYFIVQRNEGAAYWITGQTEDTAAWSRKIPEVAALLDQSYDEEITIEDFTLFRRRAP